MKIKKSFSKKLLFIFIVCGIVPMLILGIFETYKIIKRTKENSGKFISSNLNISSKLIDNNISSYKRMVDYIANNKDVKSIVNKIDTNNDQKFEDTQVLYKMVNAIMATSQHKNPVHIVQKNGVSRYSSTDYYYPIYTDKEGDFYDILDKSPEKVFTKVHRRVDGEYSKDTVMVIGQAIIDDTTKDVIGYVLVDIYEDYFQEIFNSISNIESSNNYILDQFGVIITDKNYKNQTGFKFGSEEDSYLLEEDGEFIIRIDGIDYMAYFTTAKETRIKVLEVIPQNLYFSSAINSVEYLVVFIVIIIIIAICLELNIINKISKPILQLKDLMEKVEEGNFDVQIEVNTEDEIGVLSKGFNNMVYKIKKLIEDGYKSELLVKQAEFNALKSQINPHFLYNSLGSINWMVRLGEVEEVAEMTESLANFYRYSVKNNEDNVYIREEINQIKNYLTIQKHRYKDRFCIEILIDNNILNKKMLKLLLQPLVENAIVHGLEKKIGKGRLFINGYQDGECIIFEIIDDGDGLNNSETYGEGVAIDNIRKRIDIFYGMEYGFELNRKDDFTIARLKLKVMEENDV